MNFVYQITGVAVGGPASNLAFERANLVRTTDPPKIVSCFINVHVANLTCICMLKISIL